MKKGFEPSKDGYEHDNLDAEMREAKEAAEAKYGGKVRRITPRLRCCLPLWRALADSVGR